MYSYLQLLWKKSEAFISFFFLIFLQPFFSFLALVRFLFFFSISFLLSLKHSFSVGLSLLTELITQTCNSFISPYPTPVCEFHSSLNIYNFVLHWKSDIWSSACPFLVQSWGNWALEDCLEKLFTNCQVTMDLQGNGSLCSSFWRYQDSWTINSWFLNSANKTAVSCRSWWGAV